MKTKLKVYMQSVAVCSIATGMFMILVRDSEPALGGCLIFFLGSMFGALVVITHPET